MGKRATTGAAQLLTPQALGAGPVRILRWLARYPFQRAEDLEIALHPWHKRTSVYRYLAYLEDVHLVETLRPAALQGKQLYHLSPLGYAWHQGYERDGSMREATRPSAFQIQKETLTRLLPRLPVLLTLQDFVNGLAMGAADVLTQNGRRADLVRWDWERDFTHAFFSRERPTSLYVDGAVALCVRFEATAAGPFQEIWHTFFCLYSPLLDDVRLMRQRLERVLRWRESAERWPVYSQMPPLLILATSLRQAAWWQRATEQATASFRVDLPRGAVACWPATGEERVSASPWHLAWRSLGTNSSCTIQQLLHPVPSSAIQALIVQRTRAQEDPLSAVHEPPTERRRRRLNHSYGLAAFCTDIRLPKPKQQKPADFRLASVQLTPRHWELLSLCQAHPLVSQDDLAGVLGLEPVSIHQRLTEAQKAGYLVGEESVVGLRWHLSEAGLRLLAQAAHCSVRHLGYFPDDPSAPLQQRGVRGRFLEIRHTAGVYGFFATLASALRVLPDAGLQWWETGWICERRFSSQERLYSLKPDALASYQIGSKTRRFWLEWDRGTMNERDLQMKFVTYGAYLVAREWARGETISPALLCVAPDIAQEQVLTRVAQAKLVNRSEPFMYTTTASLLAREGILAPIWRPVLSGSQCSAPQEGHRCAVFTERLVRKHPPPT